MAATTNIFRRGAVYYYRRRLRWPDGAKQSICLSLRTRRLAQARQRATQLAACCEKVRTRLIMLMQRTPLAPAQRREIFARQLALDFDALETLHAQILQMPNAEIRPQRYSEVFEEQLETMALVVREWLKNGWPRPEDYDDLAAYLDYGLGHKATDIEHVYLSASLGETLENLQATLQTGAEHALGAVAAQITDANRVAALKAIYSAKVQAIENYHEGLRHPERLLPLAERAAALPLPEGVGFEVFPDWPHNLLMQIDHGGWPADYRIGQPPHADAARGGIASLEAVPPEWSSVSIVEAGERFILAQPKTGASAAGPDDKRVSWDEKTLRQFRSALMLAGKACPGPIVAVTHDDLNRLNILFGQLPVHHHKSPRDEAMTLDAIAAEAAGLCRQGKLAVERIGLSIPTINRHWRFIEELFRWVATRVPLHDIRWAEFKGSDRRNKRDLRKNIIPADARCMFDLPIWTGCRSEKKRFLPGPHVFHDSAYWVPLIFWYSGARETEIAILLTTEVRCENGIWSILVDANEYGRIKNTQSKRKIPLASELIRLGFVEYVTELQRRGARSVFPDLVGRKTLPGARWYGKYGRFLKRHLPFLEAGMGMHSMRHSVETELKKVRVAEEMRNDLLGRLNRSEGSGRYAKAAEPAELVEIVEQIPVVTEHLIRQPLRFHPSVLAQPPRTALAKQPKRRIGAAARPPAADPSPTHPKPRLIWNAHLARSGAPSNDGLV